MAELPARERYPGRDSEALRLAPLNGRNMLKRFTSIGLLAALSPVLLSAGPVFGYILLNGGALRGATVIVRYGGREVGRQVTLDDGSYRLSAPNGRCSIAVVSSAFAGEARGEVVSSDVAAQYTFDVVRGGNGAYELRRR